MYISWWEILLLLAVLEIYDGHIHRNPESGANDALFFYQFLGAMVLYFGTRLVIIGAVLWFLYQVCFGA